jgi:hypothetical protein
MWTTSGTTWHEFQALADMGYVVFWSTLIPISRHLLLSDGRLIRLRYEMSVHLVHVD